MALTAQLFRADDERAADRQTVNLDGTLRQEDDCRPVDVTIDDLSATGFRMTCAERLPVNAMVSVGIAGLGRHSARVVRSSGEQYGCRFLVPLDVQGRVVAPADTIVAADFRRADGGMAAVPADPPLDALELRLRRFRGPIIVAGFVIPWLALGAIGIAIL